MNWFEDPTFWDCFYDWMFPESSFRDADEQTDDIITLTGIKKGAVLDLCCGPGRFSVPFAKRQFYVTGVDLQPGLLETARDYAAREQVDINYVEADMLAFRQTDTFDLVISMFSSFGYFDNPDDDFTVLHNACLSLKNNGKMVIDLRGKEIHAMAHHAALSYELPNGDFIFQRTQVTDGWTSTRSQWIYVRGNVARTYDMHFNLYSAAELTAMLKQAGFASVRVYGDLQGSAYDQNAKRLVAVAEK